MSRDFYQVQSFTCLRSVGYLIRRLHTLLLPRAEALFADAELSLSQWVVLMSLRDGVADTCADIARHMNHDTGATTRLVDQLERRGLVARRRSTADRRIVHLKLLPEGHAMAAALTPRIVGFWNRMLADFTTAEAAGFIRVLTRLNQKLEAEPVAALVSSPRVDAHRAAVQKTSPAKSRRPAALRAAGKSAPARKGTSAKTRANARARTASRKRSQKAKA